MMIHVLLTIVFLVGMFALAHERYLGLFLIIGSFTSLIGYTYVREQAVKEYLNGELSVDTLSVSAEGKIFDIELKYK